MMARLCGEYSSDIMEPAGTLLSLTLDFTAFLRVVRQLVPQWKNECSLLDRCGLHGRWSGFDGRGAMGILTMPWPTSPCRYPRLFAIFCDLSRDGKLGHADDSDARSPVGLVAALASDLARAKSLGEPNLSFEQASPTSHPPLASPGRNPNAFAAPLDASSPGAQLVHGLGWLLRGTSKRRSELCFRCFDADGSGKVRALWIAQLTLCAVYTL